VDLTGDADSARTRLVETLQQIDAGGGTGWPDHGSPFPGLRPFNTDQHRVFFGRRSEVAQLAEMLRSPAERADAALLLVIGPSGCGKSSLVRAGLVPSNPVDPHQTAHRQARTPPSAGRSLTDFERIPIPRRAPLLRRSSARWTGGLAASRRTRRDGVQGVVGVLDRAHAANVSSGKAPLMILRWRCLSLTRTPLPRR
jgi:hypothetical protein